MFVHSFPHMIFAECRVFRLLPWVFRDILYRKRYPVKQRCRIPHKIRLLIFGAISCEKQQILLPESSANAPLFAVGRLLCSLEEIHQVEARIRPENTMDTVEQSLMRMLSDGPDVVR